MLIRSRKYVVISSTRVFISVNPQIAPETTGLLPKLYGTDRNNLLISVNDTIEDLFEKI